jgi:hypothetical protein
MLLTTGLTRNKTAEKCTRRASPRGDRPRSQCDWTDSHGESQGTRCTRWVDVQTSPKMPVTVKVSKYYSNSKIGNRNYETDYDLNFSDIMNGVIELQSGSLRNRLQK